MTDLRSSRFALAGIEQSEIVTVAMVYGNLSQICFNCTQGSYAEAGAAACTLCEPGKYSEAFGIEAKDPSVCLPCRAGTQSAAGASACSDCLAGTYSLQGMTDLRASLYHELPAEHALRTARLCECGGWESG